MKKAISLLGVLLSLVMLSCVSTVVKIATEPQEGYETYYNDQFVGISPSTVETSNLFWKDHKVKFVKNGKVVLEADLEKEVKWANCCLVYPTIIAPLWGYGPKKSQSFYVGTVPGGQGFESAPLVTGKKMRVAVMDFRAKDVARTTARTVSELLRTELISAGSFIVIEKSQMGKILKEHNFQKSGCTEVACAVKIGKLVSARKILIGSVTKKGSIIVISGKIVDVEKGVEEKTATQSAGDEDELVEAAHLFLGQFKDLD